MRGEYIRLNKIWCQKNFHMCLFTFFNVALENLKSHMCLHCISFPLPVPGLTRTDLSPGLGQSSAPQSMRKQGGDRELPGGSGVSRCRGCSSHQCPGEILPASLVFHLHAHVSDSLLLTLASLLLAFADKHSLTDMSRTCQEASLYPWRKFHQNSQGIVLPLKSQPLGPGQLSLHQVPLGILILSGVDKHCFRTSSKHPHGPGWTWACATTPLLWRLSKLSGTPTPLQPEESHSRIQQIFTEDPLCTLQMLSWILGVKQWTKQTRPSLLKPTF